MRGTLALVTLLLAAACAQVPDPDEAEALGGVDEPEPVVGDVARRPDADLLDRLRAIEGLTVEEVTAPAGYRFFTMTYRQPVHHWDDSQGTFEQRLTLLHKNETAPTVLVSTGYNISLGASRSEPTRLLDGNQVTVEHRFFTPSRPSPANWKRLNVQQAAADHHRIVRALKAIYTGGWVSTGASKGGMTSVYHRRFYPKDMVATVAYVAPNDVDNADDAYGAFLANVGTDATCREGLKRVQREALEKRAEMLPLLDGYAKTNGLTYIGDAAHALEVMVVDTPFIFWQYGGQGGCADIPPAGAPASALFQFIDDTVGVDSYSQADAARYVPYYYQAATQLGYPSENLDHLAGLLTFPEAQEPRWYLPADLAAPYSPKAMKDIDGWVKKSAERLMLIYGEYDPWSAEQFQLGSGTKDSVRYIVPRGNHGSKIGQLPAEQKAEATAKLRAWLGLPRVDERQLAPGPLDQVDELMIARPRL